MRDNLVNLTIISKALEQALVPRQYDIAAKAVRHAIAEIERLRAQNVGHDEGCKKLRQAMIPVLRERQRWGDPRFAYGDNREVWLKLGDVRKLCAAFEVASEKRGSECGALNASPEIHQPSQ